MRVQRSIGNAVIFGCRMSEPIAFADLGQPLIDLGPKPDASANNVVRIREWRIAFRSPILSNPVAYSLSSR
ncbi:hypothetical protein ART_3830 [Arthrobacter sp. PAMC 25486]|nr:hypothetical protein ART_3830 [Arthrobacter sp. PAMC 25486]